MLMAAELAQRRGPWRGPAFSELFSEVPKVHCVGLNCGVGELWACDHLLLFPFHILRPQLSPKLCHHLRVGLSLRLLPVGCGLR